MFDRRIQAIAIPVCQKAQKFYRKKQSSIKNLKETMKNLGHIIKEHGAKTFKSRTEE